MSWSIGLRAVSRWSSRWGLNKPVSKLNKPVSNKRGSARRGSGGFTLLEVLVAFTILALSLGAVFQVWSIGLRSTSQAESRALAVLLLESKLAGIGIEEPLESGEQAGEFDNGFRWHASVEPYEAAPTEAEAEGFESEGVGPGPGFVPYQVVVTVRWGERENEHALSLTTLRLGPPQ